MIITDSCLWQTPTVPLVVALSLMQFLGLCDTSSTYGHREPSMGWTAAVLYIAPVLNVALLRTILLTTVSLLLTTNCWEESYQVICDEVLIILNIFTYFSVTVFLHLVCKYALTQKNELIPPSNKR